MISARFACFDFSRERSPFLDFGEMETKLHYFAAGAWRELVVPDLEPLKPRFPLCALVNDPDLAAFVDVWDSTLFPVGGVA